MRRGAMCVTVNWRVVVSLRGRVCCATRSYKVRASYNILAHIYYYNYDLVHIYSQ